MRFGISGSVWNTPFTTADLERLAPHIKELGFDWLEVPLDALNGLDWTRGAAILNAAGLGVSVCTLMGQDRDLLHPEDEARERGKRYLQQAIAATQTLGATILCGPLYASQGRVWQPNPIERARETDLLVALMRELAGYAQEHAVMLCLEPLNRFETSFMNVAAHAVQIIDRVGHPNCGIALDTFHMNIEEKHLGEAIHHVGSRLKHFHASENDRGAPGRGHVPWHSVAQALKDIRYDGALVIESFTFRSKAAARTSTWREVEPSPDALAEQGLKHLRQLLKP